jgi:hypothetical protein
MCDMSSSWIRGVAGIVSLRDLLAVDIDEKDEAIGLLNAYVHYIPADVDIRLKT